MISQAMREALDRSVMNAEDVKPNLSKGQPAVLEREDKRKKKKLSAAEFRKAVWLRDEGRSRASKKPLAKSGTDPHRVGEIHHVIARSLAPDRIFEVGNGILLSRFEHALAEANCPNDPAHHLLDIEGDEDRGKKQKFIFRDANGKVTKERIG